MVTGGPRLVGVIHQSAINPASRVSMDDCGGGCLGSDPRLRLEIVQEAPHSFK